MSADETPTVIRCAALVKGADGEFAPCGEEIRRNSGWTRCPRCGVPLTPAQKASSSQRPAVRKSSMTEAHWVTTARQLSEAMDRLYQKRQNENNRRLRDVSLELLDKVLSWQNTPPTDEQRIDTIDRLVTLQRVAFGALEE